MFQCLGWMSDLVMWVYKMGRTTDNDTREGLVREPELPVLHPTRIVMGSPVWWEEDGLDLRFVL